ncbi:hypothetical protein C0992_004657 [Termitomyces sp. T32_za158]|nr:hypothetical protein C0992_004657 [Termitomyces sp. T32_za158]
MPRKSPRPAGAGVVHTVNRLPPASNRIRTVLTLLVAAVNILPRPRGSTIEAQARVFLPITDSHGSRDPHIFYSNDARAWSAPIPPRHDHSRPSTADHLGGQSAFYRRGGTRDIPGMSAQHLRPGPGLPSPGAFHLQGQRHIYTDQGRPGPYSSSPSRSGGNISPVVKPDSPASISLSLAGGESARYQSIEDWLRENAGLTARQPISLWSLPDPPAGSRPNVTYKVLVSLAIWGSPSRRLSLQEIYSEIENRFPYYKNLPDESGRDGKSGGKKWQRSVRHNLSLESVFHNEGRDISEPGSILGLIFLFIAAILLYLCMKGRRKQHDPERFLQTTEQNQTQRSAPFAYPWASYGNSNYHVVGWNDRPPRSSGGEADPFLAHTTDEIPQSGPTQNPNVPPFVGITRVPVPPLGSQSSKGSESTGESFGTDRSGYGVLVERPTLNLNPSTTAELERQRRGHILAAEELDRINEEAVLPQESEGELSPLHPLPHSLDPNEGWTSGNRNSASLNPFVKRPSQNSLAAYPDADEAATLSTARRVRVEELASRSPPRLVGSFGEVDSRNGMPDVSSTSQSCFVPNVNRGLPVSPVSVDILDMPVPAAVSPFNSSIKTSTSMMTDNTDELKVHPFPPGLVVPSPKSWTDEGSSTAHVIPPIRLVNASANVNVTPSSTMSSQDTATAISMDILEEAPPSARECWRSLAAEQGILGRRTTFGLPISSPVTSEQCSLYSTNSHLSPPHTRSTGSDPTSSRRDLSSSVSSVSSRPSAFSAARSHSLAHSESVSSDSRKRPSPARSFSPRPRPTPPLPSPLLNVPQTVHYPPERAGTHRMSGSHDVDAERTGTPSSEPTSPLSQISNAPWAGGLCDNWTPSP